MTVRSYFARLLNLAVAIFVLSTMGIDQAFARAGGADPTGGEGQRSSSQELRATVESQMAELPSAFFRLKMFLESPDAADEKAVEDLGFLRSCFAKPSTCHGEVNATIESLRKKFRNSPNYVAGDCPSTTISHESTDMSITTELDLCVSEKLTRYPPREMRRQAFSLLAHEVVHGLGFGETEARALQNWFLENHAVVQPAASFRSKFNSLNASPVAGIRMLARDLDYLPTSVERLCIFAGKLALDLHNVNDLYSAKDDEDALIGVPSYPIRQLGQQADQQVLALIVPYCISKKPLGDGAEFLTGLKRVAKTLDGLRAYLDVYSRSSAHSEPIESIASAQAALNLLVADNDFASTNVPAGRRLICKVQGEEAEREIGKSGAFIPLGVLEPGVTMKTKIEVARFRESGGLGVGIFPSALCEDEDCWGRYVAKVVSSNADVVTEKVLPWNSQLPLKVLGREHEFRSVFQFQRRNQAGRLENVGSPFEVVCENK